MTPRSADAPLEIVHVANLRHPKGHPHAMRIAQELKRRNVHFRWRCVGNIPDGESRDFDYLEETRRLRDEFDIQDEVVFEGPQSDIGPFLERAHVGVLTSDSEAFPVALLEYMAAGLPIVVTDIGENRAIADGTGGGAAHAIGDVDGFATTLERWYHHESERETLGRQARRSVVEQYSLESVTRQLIELYYTVLPKKHRTAGPGT